MEHLLCVKYCTQTVHVSLFILHKNIGETREVNYFFYNYTGNKAEYGCGVALKSMLAFPLYTKNNVFHYKVVLLLAYRRKSPDNLGMFRSFGFFFLFLIKFIF